MFSDKKRRQVFLSVCLSVIFKMVGWMLAQKKDYSWKIIYVKLRSPQVIYYQKKCGGVYFWLYSIVY